MEKKKLMMDDPDFVLQMQQMLKDGKREEFLKLSSKAFTEDPEETARQIIADADNVWVKLDLFREIQDFLISLDMEEDYMTCAVLQQIHDYVRETLDI